MARQRRGVGAAAPARKKIGRRRTYRSRQSKEAKPSSWFGFLRAWIAEDFEQRGEPPELDEDEVLTWADAYHERTGQWPIWRSGPIPEAPGETWLSIEAALTFGLRGFLSGGTIPRFLDAHRGRYNPSDQRFSVGQILAWVDAWHGRTGEWPTADSGDVPETGGIKWQTVDTALRMGRGGLDAGSSLSRLLASERGVFSVVSHLPLTEDQILAWADAWRERTGGWPSKTSGDVPGLEGITWSSVDNALRFGRSGLSGGSSLARLLERERGVRNIQALPRLTEDQILAWADAYYQETGTWPKPNSGTIADAAPGETWKLVNFALHSGARGLSGGSSLPHLLATRRGVRNRKRLPPLDEEQILAWADAYHARHGDWPDHRSGPIQEAPGETWQAVASALQAGLRGLRRGSSLTRLLAERGRVRHRKPRRPLTIAQVLAWADAYHTRTGLWPTAASGPIVEAPGETWNAVDHALYEGLRGLPGGSSLPRLLVQERGMRREKKRPSLSIRQILRWADAHHDRHGTWPTHKSGPIPEAPDVSWLVVSQRLRLGGRGLPGGSSLARLLATRRGVRSKGHLAPLRVSRILAWADAYHDRHGTWPNARSGPIPEAPGETWLAVDSALKSGLRGLPGGSSLPRLLAERCGVRNRNLPPPLTIAQILAWADAHHARTGQWPKSHSGPIDEAPGETWAAVHRALYQGLRGLPGGSSLPRLLARERGVPNEKHLPLFRVPDILRWADAHHDRHGTWPTARSGPIQEAPGENWFKVHEALYKGQRGLRGGYSLARLLADRRGVRNIQALPHLTVPQILAWADAYFLRHGRWPNCRSGPIPESEGDNWQGVENALSKGLRGLPGGSSVARLLHQERPVSRSPAAVR